MIDQTHICGAFQRYWNCCNLNGHEKSWLDAVGIDTDGVGHIVQHGLETDTEAFSLIAMQKALVWGFALGLHAAELAGGDGVGQSISDADLERLTEFANGKEPRGD